MARAAQQGLQQARNELRQQEEAERTERRGENPLNQNILEAIEAYTTAAQNT